MTTDPMNTFTYSYADGTLPDRYPTRPGDTGMYRHATGADGRTFVTKVYETDEDATRAFAVVESARVHAVCTGSTGGTYELDYSRITEGPNAGLTIVGKWTRRTPARHLTRKFDRRDGVSRAHYHFHEECGCEWNETAEGVVGSRVEHFCSAHLAASVHFNAQWTLATRNGQVTA